MGLSCVGARYGRMSLSPANPREGTRVRHVEPPSVLDLLADRREPSLERVVPTIRNPSPPMARSSRTPALSGFPSGVEGLFAGVLLPRRGGGLLSICSWIDRELMEQTSPPDGGPGRLAPPVWRHPRFSLYLNRRRCVLMRAAMSDVDADPLSGDARHVDTLVATTNTTP